MFPLIARRLNGGCLGQMNNLSAVLCAGVFVKIK